MEKSITIYIGLGVKVCNTTFNNISAIS